MTARPIPHTFPLATAHVSVPVHVVYRAFAGETVILNLETGKYHGLNATGGRMLQLLERCDNVADAASAFASNYGKPADEVEEDVRSFCTRLFERGLIELTLNGSR